MTPSRLSCHPAAFTQCQESEGYCHTGATTQIQDSDEMPSNDGSFTSNYILKINTQRRQERERGVCHRVNHISSGNSLQAETYSREKRKASSRQEKNRSCLLDVRGKYLVTGWQLLTKREQEFGGVVTRFFDRTKNKRLRGRKDIKNKTQEGGKRTKRQRETKAGWSPRGRKGQNHQAAPAPSPSACFSTQEMALCSQKGRVIEGVRRWQGLQTAVPTMSLLRMAAQGERRGGEQGGGQSWRKVADYYIFIFSDSAVTDCCGFAFHSGRLRVRNLFCIAKSQKTAIKKKKEKKKKASQMFQTVTKVKKSKA